jgi:DNA-binding SARP family transcriptional activator
LVGQFGVCREGRPQRSRDVGSRKARRLLALLAVERGCLVPVDRVIVALWYGRPPPRRAAENVATLVSRLRRTLGRDAVLGGRSGYRLGKALGVDLHAAAGFVRDAEASLKVSRAAPALTAAQRALGIVDGAPVLADEPDAPWAQPARIMHGDLVRRALHATTEAALRLGDVAAAKAAAQAAIVADPLDEAGYRALMRAFHAAHEPARAIIAYEELRRTMATELGIDPAAATREIHVAILRGGHPPDRSEAWCG